MDSKKRLWIYTGLVMAAGIGLVVVIEPGSSKIPLLGPGARLLLIGDSLAQGLGTPLRQLARDGSVTFQVDGRLGTRIDQWASQTGLPLLLKQFQPTIVFVSLGTNDMKLANPLSEQGALTQLIATLRQSGVTVVWLTPPKMPFPDRGVRGMIRGTGLPLFESEALMIPRGADKVHPTPAGYSGWAAAVWQWANRLQTTQKVVG